MRILLLGLNFYPELTGIGKYTGEMAAYLVEAGHHVRVVTAPPYYPHWRVGPSYSWWQYRREKWQGMWVFRSPLWVPGSPSGVKRLIHLLSFTVSSFPVVLGQVAWKPHVVLCIAPALLSAPAGLLVARICRAKAWLHIQDFELDTATNLGLLPGGHLLAKGAAYVESWLLNCFDRVTTISQRMLSRLKEKGVNHKKAGLFPNWVDTKLIHPLPDSQENLRKVFHVPVDKVIVLYSGNMGQKQGLELVVQAAKVLQTERHIHFVLCGDGAVRGDLEKAAGRLSNVQFLSLQPPEKLNQLLNAGDIHILPQRADAADLVMPSKLLGMLASGRAVIATADPATEVGAVIEKTGMLVPPDDCEGLCEAIKDLGSSPQKRNRFGRSGRALVRERWGAEKVLSGFQSQLLQLVGNRPSENQSY